MNKEDLIQINEWVDVDSPLFQRITLPILFKYIINISLEAGVIRVDKSGYLWNGNIPVYAELDGKLVGITFLSKTVNIINSN